jgi:hypothetical protein
MIALLFASLAWGQAAAEPTVDVHVDGNATLNQQAPSATLMLAIATFVTGITVPATTLLNRWVSKNTARPMEADAKQELVGQSWLLGVIHAEVKGIRRALGYARKRDDRIAEAVAVLLAGATTTADPGIVQRFAKEMADIDRDELSEPDIAPTQLSAEPRPA